jgi:hypothetical protein
MCFPLCVTVEAERQSFTYVVPVVRYATAQSEVDIPKKGPVMAEKEYKAERIHAR